MEGTVKFFNRRKGFGFIHGDDGKDYFVHFTALPQGVFLRENDRVAFEGATGDRGLKAEHVRLLEKGSERGSAEPGASSESGEYSDEEGGEGSQEEESEEEPEKEQEREE